MKNKYKGILVLVALVIPIFITTMYVSAQQLETLDDTIEAMGTNDARFIPSDFFVHIEWGQCKDEAERYVFTLEADGSAYKLHLDQGHLTGRENNFTIPRRQVASLIRLMKKNEIFDIEQNLTSKTG